MAADLTVTSGNTQVFDGSVNYPGGVDDNGGTLVIGGMFEISEREDVTRVPLLGDIPWLGGLFRSRSQVTEKKEMLVFITPTIVESRRMALR